MAAILLGDRRLTDLKVTELKSELEKRGLPKKGVKSVLVERLKKAILQEELSNVNEEELNEEELDESGHDTSADTSQMSQDESDGEGGRAEPAAPAEDPGADFVIQTDSSSVDIPITPPPAEPAEPAVPETEETMVDVTEVAAEEEEEEDLETHSTKVPEQQNSETDREPTHVAVETAAEEVAMGTVETKDSVVTNDVVEDDKSQTNQPMDLGSPLDSDPEFDLLSGELDESIDAATKEEEESVCGTEDTQQTVEKEKEEEHSEEAVVKAEEEEEREGEKEIDADAKMKKEEEDSKDLDGGERRMERLDSTFDSSYEPATEELLYEGDPETEPKQDTSQEVPTTEDLASSREEEGGGEKMCDTSASEKREEEEGFMVEVHYKDQGGILEDPAATVIGPASSSRSNSGEKAGKAGKPSGVAGGKTTGESNRSEGCHLWVAGLVGSVRALDLQTLFSSFGQVVSAKVVAKAQSKARFGYVTMGTREQAQRCIAQLSGTELKGNTIHVELAKTAPPLSQASNTKSPGTQRSSTSSTSRTGKDGGGKSSHDTLRDKDKVGQAITTKSPGGLGGDGKGGGGKGRDDRRRSSGSTARYHGDDRPSHSRRSRSPPPRRSPRGGRPRTGGRTSPSPRGSASYTGSSLRTPSNARDARDDIIRREEQRRDLMERRLGADPYYRDGSRQVVMEDRRFADRYQELAARRQLEMEHTRREQEMARRMQEVREREARDREVRERQLAEQERVFKERERVIREREYRERQRREQLEKELRDRVQREKELRERERRLREQHIREIQEREMKVAREREMREREVQAQVQRERDLREKEQRLIQEHERMQKEKQLYEEQQRRMREEAERREREREAREREARERDRKLEAERERRLREEKERERHEREEERLQLERAAKLDREREQQKRKQEELKWSEESRMLQQQRLGKRGTYQESSGYDVPKRQAMHDLRGSPSVRGTGGGGDLYDIQSSVFSRLDPQKQAAVEARVSQLGAGGLPGGSGMIPGGSGGGKGGMADSYARRSTGDSGSGGYRQGGYGVGVGGGGGGMGRERHMDGVSYPIPGLGKPGQNSSPGYQKGTIAGGVTVLKGGGLTRQNQEMLSAALASFQKTVSPSSSVAGPMRMTGSSPIQQMSPAGHLSGGGMGDFMSRGEPMGGQMAMGGVPRQMMGGGGGVGVVMKPGGKLPPVEERYNRRFSRPSHGGRQANVKRF